MNRKPLTIIDDLIIQYFFFHFCFFNFLITFRCAAATANDCTGQIRECTYRHFDSMPKWYSLCWPQSAAVHASLSRARPVSKLIFIQPLATTFPTNFIRHSHIQFGFAKYCFFCPGKLCLFSFGVEIHLRIILISILSAFLSVRLSICLPVCTLSLCLQHFLSRIRVVRVCHMMAFRMRSAFRKSRTCTCHWLHPKS